MELDLSLERTKELPFEEFFSDEYPRLTRALFLLSGDAAEAEDLAQEALARTYERWGRVRRMESPTGYVYRTAMNLHRRRRRRAGTLARTLSSAVPEPHTTDELDRRSDVARILRTLPANLRTALILHEWLGMTSEEAAEVMGIRPGSARARLHRARQLFRHRLGEGYE